MSVHDYPTDSHTFIIQPEAETFAVGADPKTVARDLAPSNLDRYQNAAAIASMLVEGAWRGRGYKSGADTSLLASKIDEVLIDPLPTGSAAFVGVECFRDALTDRAISSGGGNHRMITCQPEVAGDFVGRRLEYDDLGSVADQTIASLGRGPAQPGVVALAQAADSLADIRSRRQVLCFRPQYTDDKGDYNADISFRDWLARGVVGYYYPPVDNNREHLAKEDRKVSETVDDCRQRLATTIALESVLADETLVMPDSNQLGAKGANLQRMHDVLEGLRGHGIGLAERIAIPPFHVVTTEAYEQWRRSGDIDGAVDDVANWIQTVDPDAAYLVRSSAVKSEDGEHTGAGIYESVLMPENPARDDIAVALGTVYASTTSENALAYQRSIGVADEQMAAVVQKVADPHMSAAAMVTVNSVMPHVLQLTDYIIEQGMQPLFGADSAFGQRRVLPLDRDGLFREFGSDVPERDVEARRFHVPPDTDRHTTSDSWLAAQATVFAEMVLGRPVQIEAVIPEATPYVIQLVQARPLPAGLLEPVAFDGFPREEAWYEGRGIGVMDGEEATVVSAEGMKSDDVEDALQEYEGMLLLRYKESFSAGQDLNDVRRTIESLPEADRQRILCLIERAPDSRSGSGYGHLETLFAEMAVRMVFAEPRTVSRAPTMVDGQKVNVYSNGYEAKVYLIENDPVYIEYRRRLYGNDEGIL